MVKKRLKVYFHTLASTSPTPSAAEVDLEDSFMLDKTQ